MKKLIFAAAALSLSVVAAQAQSMNKQNDAKQQSSGTTGAMGNANADGVATDPAGVAAQQGRSVEASPGTVGAAPAANTPSQKPSH